MDILHLIDQLEELFNESKSFWLTSDVMIKEERLLDLIDQMRLSIPDEIKNSQQIINQKDRILAQAQEEANRTIELARGKSVEMVDRDRIVESANIKAEQIIRRAEEQAELIRRDADEYAVESLKNFQLELERLMTQVINGINALGGKAAEQDQEEQIPQSVPGYKDISSTSSK